MIMTRIKRSPRKRQHWTIWIMTIMFLLASMSWLYSRIQSTQRIHQYGHETVITITSPITLLTEPPSSIVITTDVRGNLGPPESMLNNGTDWIKDRWQAASDMHGTAIKGVHWVHLDFQRLVTVSTVILDWEAAYSDDYKIEGRLKDGEEYFNLFDSDNDGQQRKTSEAGQSPGVKAKTPLHIIHTIEMIKESDKIQQIRIWIRSSTMDWGVSLWEVKLLGRKY